MDNPPRCEGCRRFGHHARLCCEWYEAMALYHNEPTRTATSQRIPPPCPIHTRSIKQKQEKRRARRWKNLTFRQLLSCCHLSSPSYCRGLPVVESRDSKNSNFNIWKTLYLPYQVESLLEHMPWSWKPLLGLWNTPRHGTRKAKKPYCFRQ